jgi:hypothetical protein
MNAVQKILGVKYTLSVSAFGGIDAKINPIHVGQGLYPSLRQRLHCDAMNTCTVNTSQENRIA